MLPCAAPASSGPAHQANPASRGCRASSPTSPACALQPAQLGNSYSPRPPRQSFLEGPSTVFWVAVVACTVVIRPSRMPAGGPQGQQGEGG